MRAHGKVDRKKEVSRALSLSKLYRSAINKNIFFGIVVYIIELRTNFYLVQIMCVTRCVLVKPLLSVPDERARTRGEREERDLTTDVRISSYPSILTVILRTWSDSKTGMVILRTPSPL